MVYEPGTLTDRIRGLPEPILVLGASGFIGANILRRIFREGKDVYGTAQQLPAWRLTDIPKDRLIISDLLLRSNLINIVRNLKPRVFFDCVAYGGYSFETDAELIYKTNFHLTAELLQLTEKLGISAYIHAGSSSEYGENCQAPHEDAAPLPNSDYAVSKVACSTLISYYGRKRGFPCVNLRLYSVYGPLEDPSRLFPTLM